MTPGPDSAEATPSYMLEEKVKLNRLTELYKYLGVKGDPNLANLGEIWVKKKKKKKIQKQAILTCFSWMPRTNGFTLPNKEVVFMR